MKKILTGFLLLCSINSFAQTEKSFSSFAKQFIKIQSDTFALTDAEVIDGTGASVKHHQTIRWRRPPGLCRHVT